MPISNPSARSMCVPRDLSRRCASAVAGPDREITVTDTLLGRAPCNAVYPALPQRGLPSEVLGNGHQDCLRSLLLKTTVLRPAPSSRKTDRTRVYSGMTQWDTLGRGSNTIRWHTKGTSLSRLASTVLRAASLVPWSGGPSGNGWPRLLLRHPKGWRASQLRYVSGRKRLIEALARDRCAL